jgi:hypothetical protein
MPGAVVYGAKLASRAMLHVVPLSKARTGAVVVKNGD